MTTTIASESTRTLAGKAAMLTAAAMLSACAAPYQEPAGNAVARIRLASSQTSVTQANIHMNGYPSGTCMNPMRIGMVGGLASFSDEVPLGIPGSDKLPPKSFVERKIPAGQRYLFTVRVLSGGSCVSTGSFIPAAGSDYEIRMGWDAAKTVCHTTLHQVSVDATGTAVLKGEPTFVKEAECRAGLN